MSGKAGQLGGEADGERQAWIIGVEPGFADMLLLQPV
jgi:hypothetical protein